MSNITEYKWLLVKYHYTLQKTPQEFTERIFVRLMRYGSVPDIKVFKMFRRNDITYVYVSFEPHLAHDNVNDLFRMACNLSESLEVLSFSNEKEFADSISDLEFIEKDEEESKRTIEKLKNVLDKTYSNNKVESLRMQCKEAFDKLNEAKDENMILGLKLTSARKELSEILATL